MTATTRHVVVIAALFGSFAALSATVATTEAGAQTTLRACYIPNTGVVYRVGLEDTAEHCRSDRHVEFSWTDGAGSDHGALTGLVDDDHPQYLQAGEVPSAWAGMEHVSSQPSFGVGPMQTISIGTSINCPRGKIVISGGYSIAAPNDLETVLVSNGPSGIGQWSVRFRVTNPRDENVFPIPLAIRANCVNGPPGS